MQHCSRVRCSHCTRTIELEGEGISAVSVCGHPVRAVLAGQRNRRVGHRRPNGCRSTNGCGRRIPAGARPQSASKAVASAIIDPNCGVRNVVTFKSFIIFFEKKSLTSGRLRSLIFAYTFPNIRHKQLAIALRLPRTGPCSSILLERRTCWCGRTCRCASRIRHICDPKYSR